MKCCGSGNSGLHQQQCPDDQGQRQKGKFHGMLQIGLFLFMGDHTDNYRTTGRFS
jgi:hypothetical protein